jgi:hypothetical protein
VLREPRDRYGGDRYRTAIALLPAPSPVPRRSPGIALFRCRPPSGRWRYIAAKLLREFRRQCRSDLAKFTEDLAQEPDARRHRVAVGFDRIDQQVEERECLLIGQVKLHAGNLASGWHEECHHRSTEDRHDSGAEEHADEPGNDGRHRRRVREDG